MHNTCVSTPTTCRELLRRSSENVTTIVYLLLSTQCTYFQLNLQANIAVALAQEYDGYKNFGMLFASHILSQKRLRSHKMDTFCFISVRNMSSKNTCIDPCAWIHWNLTRKSHNSKEQSDVCALLSACRIITVARTMSTHAQCPSGMNGTVYLFNVPHDSSDVCNPGEVVGVRYLWPLDNIIGRN